MKHVIIIRIFAVLSSTFFLSSCSPVKVYAPSTYMINRVPQKALARYTHPITMLVLHPDTVSAYNTTGMAYSTKRYQIGYYSKNQWAETPGQMLETLMVLSLQHTHYYHAVVSPPYIGPYNFSLSTQILRLEQDYTTRPPYLRLVVRVQLSKWPTNRIVATRVFHVSQPLFCPTPYYGVMAANKATVDFLSQLNYFCIKHSH